MTTALVLRNNTLALSDELPLVKKYRPPVSSGLLSIKIFGGDATRAQRNFATGLITDGLVGSGPTYGTYYTQFGDGNYLQTAIPDGADGTLIALCTTPLTGAASGSSSIPFSNLHTADQYPGTTGEQLNGRGMYFLYNGSVTTPNFEKSILSGTSNTNSGTNVSVGNITAGGGLNQGPHWYCGRWRSSDNRVQFDNKTAGTTGNKTETAAVVYGGPFVIGYSPYSTLVATPFQMYAAMAYNRYITDAERDSLYAWWQSFYGGLLTI